MSKYLTFVVHVTISIQKILQNRIHLIPCFQLHPMPFCRHLLKPNIPRNQLHLFDKSRNAEFTGLFGDDQHGHVEFCL